jgi:hypothetical protein
MPFIATSGEFRADNSSSIATTLSARKLIPSEYRQNMACKSHMIARIIQKRCLYSGYCKSVPANSREHRYRV